ncbi:glycerol-3-phosphate 1-O-acyltransferase PlsY [Tropicibacter naphthalenivorans]|uniref:Glycerol-3-phosphate acyltransferase n=1 Tax=Tropicibacter naphthalenivorans TaxID=441103 RepID=A0A0P1G029_9RHOB|nr:glycerol-3-phosphate 1-O-acyltransferase PlsY [Tropicibacter naphthalenivorans]CUH75058.1 G3P acyltransferase [Tropicibacter naphthalenivorans]SMC47035.1 acyl-phosphate glycerol-3-phosphate acyltransferase [Tropicibacter naphthalenivorans]
MLDTAPTLAILWAVIGYLLGSIPFGILITRMMNLGDLRQIGSGNIGATNVLRTGNKGAAAATLLLDGVKGAVAVLLAQAMSGDGGAMQIAGLAAFIGHCYPVWLKFQGGKGVATFLGVILALSWPVGLLCCATWLFAALVSRISSVGALTAAMASTVWMFFMARTDLIIVGTILTLLIYWRHRANLARLKAGTEPKIGAKK